MFNPAHVVLSVFPLFGVKIENTVPAFLKVSLVLVLFILLRLLMLKFTFALLVLGKVIGFPQLLMWLLH